MAGLEGARLSAEHPSTDHPDLPSERDYIERAYRRLDEIREEAKERAATHGRERFSTFAGTYERDISVRVALHRAQSLDIGDESLIFGRIDDVEATRAYIGRRAVFDEAHEPIVIDWRVPAAERFYRATGAQPMGLVLRRHFLCEGRRLLALEDERFDGASGARDTGLAGTGALIAALERPRTGTMRDIVATVQAEQDAVIRESVDGVLAVQGGPGTGKTAVALHRAAYLLFTHRQKLGRQGVLVVGPNRRFLRYIDQVLPALGENGARMASILDLSRTRVLGTEPAASARIKGDARMAEVIARGIADRQRALSGDVAIVLDEITVRFRVRESEQLVATARRNHRSHNARHSMLSSIIISKLYDRYLRAAKNTHGELAELRVMPKRAALNALRGHPRMHDLFEQMWPLLSAERFLRELFAQPELLRRAARGLLSDEELAALERPTDAPWTASDVPLLDEAFMHLGAAKARKRNADSDDEIDQIETYGHVVADEIQDFPPMALRMLARRSRAGSMTVVGDLAQSVGDWRPHSWDEILAHLPQRDPRVRELTINYRTPGPVMDVAARVLAIASPDLPPPRSARADGEPVVYQRGDVRALVARLADEHRARNSGTMLIVAPAPSIPELIVAANASDDIGAPVMALTVQDAKGLEFDDVVVVEPARLVAESIQGERALYVALTRATRTVTIVHEEPLPASLTTNEQ